MLRRQISIEDTSPRDVTVYFPVILISITSLKEFTNPHYLAVMINPFSIIFPRQKLSSPIPRLPKKWIIHNTSLVVLWQIVSLTEKEFYLFFSLHSSLMPCLLVFTIPNASPFLYLPSILPHLISSFLLYCSDMFWWDLTFLCHSEYLTLCIFTPLSNVRITTIPSKLSHLTEKMARTSRSNGLSLIFSDRAVRGGGVNVNSFS